jgi:hypothetical protein
MLECPQRMEELYDDKTFIRSAVDHRLKKYSQYHQEEVDSNEKLEKFNIREGL